MKLKLHNNISENQVEDVFVSNLNYLQKILDVPNEVKLIARQLRIKSGEQRIDLLVSHGKELCLVELKVTIFVEDNLRQIIDYKNEIIELQKNGKLLSGNVKSFLLVTEAKKSHFEICKQNDVVLIVYELIDILTDYFNSLSASTQFLRIKPNDYGVFSLGLINRALLEINNGETNTQLIANKISLSRNSVKNHLKVSKEFGLVRERSHKFFLTDLGDKYVSHINRNALMDVLTKKQIELLKQFISKDPFHSSTVFGIYSIVESSFLLSRNSYPIELEDLRGMFRTISGKVSEWQAIKSLSTATYTFLNFAIDLELLGKIGTKIVITPAGFRFILMLQLHKSIEMVESLTIK